MLPTPVLSVSGKGFARLRISAWHFSPAPPILYAVRAIVYHKSRVLSRVLRDFSGERSPRNPRGRTRAALAVPAAVAPCGGLALFVACLPCLYLLSCPLSPRPLPRRGRGRFKVILCKGLRPLHTRGLNPSGTGSTCQSGTRRGCTFGISNSAQNRQNRLSIGKAGSQGEGGPGERNFGV